MGILSERELSCLTLGKRLVMGSSSVLNIPGLGKDRDKGNESPWRHRELQPGRCDFVGISTGILGHCGIKGSIIKTSNPKIGITEKKKKSSLFFNPYSTNFFLS